MLGCRPVPPDFHARYSCRGKRYVYEIWNHPVRSPFLHGRALHYYHPIDEKLLDAAARHFIGRHDFTSFCTLDKREMGDFHRTVAESRVTREGDMVRFTVAADGFLYNMVRIMAGTLLGVQQGRFAPADMPELLLCRDRSRAGRPRRPAPAPAKGFLRSAGANGRGREVTEMAKNGKFSSCRSAKHAAAPEKQPEGEIHDEPDAAEHPALQAVPPPRISKRSIKSRRFCSRRFCCCSFLKTGRT